MPDPWIADVVRFGVFELDVRAGELRKSGVRLNLLDQPCQLLTALLERPNQLVTREELRQRLWSSDTFVDFEHGLNAVVKRLRDVLGDSADTPRFVETMPRRGYRFIAPVDRIGPGPALRSHARRSRVRGDRHARWLPGECARPLAATLGLTRSSHLVGGPCCRNPRMIRGR